MHVRPGTEEVDYRQPPPIEGLLEHLSLVVGARGELEGYVFAVTQVQNLAPCGTDGGSAQIGRSRNGVVL